MAGTVGHANPPAAASAPPHEGSVLLVACLERIVADPDLAAALAALRREDEFFAALATAMRVHGIELGGGFASIAPKHGAPALRARIEHWPLHSRRGWQPIALDWSAHGAELVWACGTPSPRAPFHEEQVQELRVRPFNRLFGVVTPITEAFVADLAAAALPLKGLVFHMSRCGSTLVAQALKAWDGVRVVSEAELLDGAILLARAGRDPQRLLLRGVAAALAQPSGNDKAVVFKLDAWHALAIDEVLSCLRAPWLFVYRNPVEVLASHRRQPGRHTVPGMLPDAWLPAEAHGGTLAQEAHAACVLGAVCAAVLPHARRENLLNYDELPQAITRVAAHFGLDGAPDGEQLTQIAARHAKHPSATFVADGDAKRAVADRAMYESAGRWMAQPYRALEETRTVLRRLRLPFACNLAGLRADLAAVVPAGWHPHFNTQYYSGDWSGIALRAQAHGRSPLYADPCGGEFADTDAMERCPHVAAFLRQLPCPIDAVRFLKLARGAEIREHRDPGLRFEDGVLRLHVAVHTHDQVEFLVGGESLRLAEGECWYVNFDLPHAVANRGGSDRVHLVVDLRVDAWVEALFARLRAEQQM